jgi:uncharacterized protein (DUF2336 family)
MMKSSAYPLLDGLLDLACRDGVDIRPTLLRVLTDLYVQKRAHSADEEAQYVELATGLIEAVDTPTRAAVITSLSHYPGAPAAILRKLTGSDVPLCFATSSRKQAETENLVELFFAAGTEERRLILDNLDAGAKASARRPASMSSEVIRRLETAALQHNTGEFSRTLERALGIGHALAERIARDHSGEPVVIAAKALGMTAAVLQRILLFLNPAIGQSVARVHDLARLFDELKPEAAEGMVAIWRKTGMGSKPDQKLTYEPAHWDDEHRGARSLASPVPHRIVRGRNENLGRVKSGER